jgi:putative DNA primase/helicase
MIDTEPAQSLAIDIAAAVEDWPDREPLPGGLPEVPALPIALLPAAFRDWIADASERLQVPAEMIAAPALVTAGAVIGRAVAILPRQRDDWWEVANLWGMVVGRPGSMKSPAVTEATRHIRHLAAEASKAHAAAEQDRAVEREAIELQIKAERGRGASRRGDPEASARVIAGLQARRAQLGVVERRYLTQDATTEKLGELLRANPRGLLVLRDELNGWLAALDKNGREGDREFYLEAWTGRDAYSFDRIGRGTLHIPALTLSIFGTIQPGKLHRYIAAAADGGAGDDGLLQRMQVTVWPDVSDTWRNVDRWPETYARERAARAFDRLDAIANDPAALGASTEQCSVPGLRFAPGAQELFDAWRADLELRLRSDELSSYPAYESHASKYRSLMPSLALITHVVDVVDEQAQPGAVTLDAAQRAAALVDFLDAHARRVYAVELEPGRAAAGALAKRITNGAVVDGMTVRDLCERGWSGLRTRNAVDAGLAVLAPRGWLRVETIETGGRPAMVVRLHPDLRKVPR